MKITSLLLLLFFIVPNFVLANDDSLTVNNLARKLSAEIIKSRENNRVYALNLVTVDEFKNILLEAIGEDKDRLARLEIVMERDEFSGQIIQMYEAFFFYVQTAYIKKRQYQMAEQVIRHFMIGFENLLHERLPQKSGERVYHATLKVLLPEYRRKACTTFLLD